MQSNTKWLLTEAALHAPAHARCLEGIEFPLLGPAYPASPAGLVRMYE
jgi:hypothetical protein